MSKKHVKLFGLLAVLVMAGAAWAAVTNGVISLSPITGAGTNLNANWTLDSTNNQNPAKAFTVTGTSPVVVQDTVTLPTPATMGASNVAVTAQLSAIVSRAGLNTPLGTRVTAGSLLTTAPTVDGAAGNVGIRSEMIYNRMFYAAPANQYNIDSAYAGSTSGARVLDDAASINMADDQVLTIKPGINAGTPRRVLGRGTDANARAGIGADDAGFLRINGGTTNLYASNNNVPTTAANMTDYSGGTFLMKGRLNLAHSNAIGMGPLTLAQDTTLGVIETSNVDIGKNAPDQTSLNNAANPASGVFQDGRYHQDITVARYDSLGAYEDNAPRFANVRGTSVKDVTFDVPKVAGVDTTLKVYTGIVQPFENWTNVVANRDYFSIRVVKTGTDNMVVEAGGMRHTGGTYVKEGTLFVDGGNTNQFVGELGSTWWLTPTVATNITAGLSPSETSSAKVNYNAYLANLALTVNAGTPVWGARGFQTGNNGGVLNDSVIAPAYMNSFIVVGDLARVVGGGYVNPLTIDAGAKVKVNRDQFIGDLNGAGTLEVASWAKNNVETIPQITMQINNTLSTNSGKNAEFSGVITGKANLVLDNPVLATGAGVNANQSTRVVNFFPRIQALTGANQITVGDTFVKDGALSVPGSDRLGPGTIRIGMYDAGYTNGNNGVAAGTANFRGFRDTLNVATFHGSDSFTVTQPVIVYAVGTNNGGALTVAGGAYDATQPNNQSVTFYGNNPQNNQNAFTNITDGRYNAVGPYVNLAASRAKTVAFPDVTLYAQNGAVPTIAQFSQRADIRYIMRNAMAVNDKLDENPSWDGTISFPASWDMVGATSAKMFGFDVKNGTLHLGTHQISGYALVGIRQAATLSLGETARDFSTDMQVVIEDDARIRVIPQTSDMAATLADAQKKDAIFLADSINYTGLGMGSDHKDKRIVVQIDLSKIGGSITDQWIKAVGSMHATNWNNIHYYPESSTGQKEHLYKVRLSQPDDQVFDQDLEVTAYCDENQYNIYVHLKKVDKPVPTPEMDITNISSPTSLNPGEALSITGTISPTTYDLDTVELFFTPTTASVDWKWTDEAAGKFEIFGDMPASTFSWYFEGTRLSDGATVKSPTKMIVVTPSGVSMTLTAESTSSTIIASVTYVDASGALAGKTVKFSAMKGTETPLTGTATTDANGKASYTFTGLTSRTTYSVAVEDVNDTTVTDSTSITTKSSGGDSGGGGCDAGFAGLALLLAAPLFLRKKD